MTPRVLFLFLCSLALPLAGCSLFNAPDRSKLEPHDGGMSDTSLDTGMDGGMDGDVDGGMDGGDGGDADAGWPPEDCMDPEDEDHNGFANCDDFACAGDPACCTTGGNLIAEGWRSVSAAWEAQPTSTTPRIPIPDGGRLIEFRGPGTSGLLHTVCQPLALGAELHAAFGPTGTCTATGAPCEAALVFTGADRIRASGGYLDDLAVRMDASGKLSITQNHVVLADAMFGGTAIVDVTLIISPSFDTAGRPTLSVTATAQAAIAGSTVVTLLEHRSFIQQRVLRTTGGCSEAPGLRFAVEGHGDGVTVEPLSLDSSGCRNPGIFSRPQIGTDDLVTIDRTNPGMGGETGGGIGAPSLFYTRDGMSTDWHIYAEATNADPALERFTHIGWAIGFTLTNTWSPAGFVSGGMTPFAFLGTNPPACMVAGGECDPSGPSFREPYAQWLNTSGEDGAARIFFAYQATPSSPHMVRWIVRHTFRADAGFNATDMASVFYPAGPNMPQDTACEELRDPAAIELADGTAWLFYTCVNNGVAPSIHAVPLRTSDHTVDDMSAAVPILSGASAGPFAAAGVWGAEPVMDYDRDGQPLLRLWFMAKSTAGDTSVGLAQATFKSSVTGVFPQLVLYDANPVMTADNRALGVCSGTCDISNIAVTRRSSSTLRFLVAHQDDDAHTLVPLEQAWDEGTPPPGS